jgi:hypothetical protein
MLRTPFAAVEKDTYCTRECPGQSSREERVSSFLALPGWISPTFLSICLFFFLIFSYLELIVARVEEREKSRLASLKLV